MQTVTLCLLGAMLVIAVAYLLRDFPWPWRRRTDALPGFRVSRLRSMASGWIVIYPIGVTMIDGVEIDNAVLAAALTKALPAAPQLEADI